MDLILPSQKGTWISGCGMPSSIPPNPYLLELSLCKVHYIYYHLELEAAIHQPKLKMSINTVRATIISILLLTTAVVSLAPHLLCGP
jgi:hypothetical protein